MYGAGAGALWGFVFLAPELVRDFNPLFLTVGRYLGFGLIAAVLAIRRWHRVQATFRKRDIVVVAQLSFVGNILYYVFLASAVKFAGIAMTSLVIGFLPVAVTIIGSREKHAVPLSRLKLSLGLCAGGAICIGWQAVSTPSVGDVGRTITGLLCALGALVSWTWFAVANSRWLVKLPQVSTHDWNLVTGMVTGLLSIALLPVAFVVDHAPHSLPAWARLVAVAMAVALFASILGNACWNRMSRLLPLTLVGQMILFETLFALIYGLTWESRLPLWSESAAFVLVAGSVVTCLAAHRRAAYSATDSTKSRKDRALAGR
ncbi:DMT family transporter [Achromobacter aloeverae]|uniref:EamA family transporter n=1 Tax=Achromobacter aloeverae TaxID=1750518 RepID=A0A4Q1HEA1_9BURK|nr:DMT family transporter [Achromobacter aloeverae]RXN83740.1 EamA family transporter [Achromobacter aloeverae]